MNRRFTRRRGVIVLTGSAALLGILLYLVRPTTHGEQITSAPATTAIRQSTHTDNRTLSGLKIRSTDPVAAYIERSKRGMTETEVRLITADYSELQLGQSPYDLENNMPAAMELRRRQQRWYLDALAEGLDLTPEQKTQARKRMEEIFEADVRALEAANSDFQQGTPSSEERWKNAKSRFWFQHDWLWDPSLAPWNLTNLSDAQIRLTFKSNIETEWKSRDKSDPSSLVETAPVYWLHFVGGSAQDPISGELVRPYSNVDGIGTPFSMARILPLTPDQLVAAGQSTGDYLTQAKRLQPAQLRLALLLGPGEANSLASEFDLPHSDYSGYPPDY